MGLLRWPESRFGCPLHILTDHMMLPPYFPIRKRLRFYVNQYEGKTHSYDKDLAQKLASYGNHTELGEYTHPL